MSGLSLATNDAAEAAKWELRPCQEEHFWFYYMGPPNKDAQTAHDIAKTIDCKDDEANIKKDAKFFGANTKKRGFKAKKNKAGSAMVLHSNKKKRRRALR